MSIMDRNIGGILEITLYRPSNIGSSRFEYPQTAPTKMPTPILIAAAIKAIDSDIRVPAQTTSHISFPRSSVPNQ